MAASRIGDTVELRWTAPARTTDGLELPDARVAPTRVQICRDPAGPVRHVPASAEPVCTPVIRAVGHGGASEAADRLPAELTAEGAKGTVLAYRVRVLNGGGRAAAASSAVLVAAGPPVPPVEGFRVTQVRDGVLLEWRGAGEGAVEVLRTLTTAPASKLSGTGRRNEPTTTVALRAGPGPAHNGAYGMLDVSARADETYTYQAQRVQTTVLGGASLTARSETTSATTVARRDTFPPDPPRGLASIPAAATSSDGPAKAAIDLSWRPNGEPDLAGYRVYRREVGPGAPSRDSLPITSALLPGPAYRDLDIVVGHRYQYAVTAVDLRGNESKRSDPVTESAANAF